MFYIIINVLMNCPICFIEIGNDYKALEWWHPYHESCISIWLKDNDTCPICVEKEHNIRIDKTLEDFDKNADLIIDGLYLGNIISSNKTIISVRAPMSKSLFDKEVLFI